MKSCLSKSDNIYRMYIYIEMLVLCMFSFPLLLYVTALVPHFLHSRSLLAFCLLKHEMFIYTA